MNIFVYLRYGLAVVILMVIFFVAGGGFSHGERFRINTISIIGTIVVSDDEVRDFINKKLEGNYFLVYSRRNSFLFPKKEIEQSLRESFPRLNTVLAQRIDGHTITINVSERKPYALWCGNEYRVINNGQLIMDNDSHLQPTQECWFIDDTGFIFDRAPTFSAGVYMEVYGAIDGFLPGGRLPPNRFIIGDLFAKLLRNNFGEPIRIEIKSEGEMVIMIRSSTQYPILTGVSIRFKDGQDPHVLIKNLHVSIPVKFPPTSVSKKKLIYIDLRFGNKVFFGFGE